MTRAAAILAVGWMCTATTAAGQSQKLTSARAGEAPYVVHYIPTGSIVLDGRLDEEVWNAIEPLPAVTHVPVFQAPPTERTEFRVAYDSDYFYFACSAYDSDPKAIGAFSLERDESGMRSDFCSIYMDTLNDEENAVSFRVGPMGNRADSQRSNDAQTNNASWDAYWDVTTIRDERGWFAEFRIPFTTMMYQSVNGRVVMGISMYRNISRKGEGHVHPALAPDRGTFSYAMSSRMRKIVFENLKPHGAPVYMTPYALAGAGYTPSLNSQKTGYIGSTKQAHEAGGDLRYGLTSNLTLQLTANTDFAQVEADDQQTNLTRFSLFFPEKRDFFQERVSNFEYSLGGNERLFHSRTIGLGAKLEPVRIYGGGRLVGRVGDWDVGILDLHTAKSTLPSENLGVARIRHRVLNPYSYVGGIVTSRIGSEGQYNLVYGTDAILRVVGNDYLVLNWAQSFDSDDPSGGKPARGLGRGIVRANWERRRALGLGYTFEVTRAGKIFEPGMGYLQRRDYTNGSASVSYGWREKPGALLNTYGVSFDGGAFRRNGDGEIETVEASVGANLMTWSQHSLNVSAPFHYENLEVGFPLVGTFVPAGTYRYVTPRLWYTGPNGDRLRTTASVTVGKFWDGNEIAASVGPVWDPSVHLNLSGSYQVDHVTFPTRHQQFTTHIARFRTNLMVSTRMSAAGFIQYNKTSKSISTNIRIRYNPREGNDLYLVWNEGLVTDRQSFTPARPLSSGRTFLIKYSRTFRVAM